MSLDITVHHFTAEPIPPSANSLLESARNLVDAAIATSQWRSVVSMPPKPVRSTGMKRVCFLWAKPPPAIGRCAFKSSRDLELQDWDAPFEDDQEILDVSALPEFEETDFGDALLHPKIGSAKRRALSRSPSPKRHFADDIDVNSDRHTLKRVRSQSQSQSSAESTSTLIPFPHYYPSPDPTCPPPPGIDKIPAFRIARSFSPSFSLTTPFSRTAWLVPLRGIPLIEGASPAQYRHVLLPEKFDLEGSVPRTIYWTSAAVTQFWAFLLRQRVMNNFGPLAVTYMISSRSSAEGRDAREEDSRRKGKGQQAKARYSQKEDQGDAWEYVKIYHDSRYAMKLRSLLDSFRWEDAKATPGDNLLPSRYRYRVLKAARLVLVDEEGAAVLVA